MSRIVSFEKKKKILAEQKKEIELINEEQEHLINMLDKDLAIGEWEKLVEKIQNNRHRLKELNYFDMENDEDFEIVFDRGLKARNSAIKAMENAKRNGVAISNEDYDKIIK